MSAERFDLLCEFCRGRGPTSGIGHDEITIRWMRARAVIVLCQPCYDLFRARMKETAIEVARTGSTMTASGWRSRLGGWCLSLARWLTMPSQVNI